MSEKKNTKVSELETLTQKLNSIKPVLQAQTALPSENPTVDAPKGVQYEDRVVAFVDILGFKEIIQRSAREPELVKQIFYALDVRKDDWATMFAKEVGLNLLQENFDDRFHSFSDCIVMSVGTRIEDIGLLIYGVFKVCRQLLGQGFASRGGIAMGKLYHHDDSKFMAVATKAPAMVFGPAFIDAYQFESAHADGPRVILQNQVWKKIEEYAEGNRTEKLSKFLLTHVQRADDRPAFIDLFADFGTNMFYEVKRDRSTEIQQIKDHICSALDSSTDKPHFFKKNAQLAREFNKAVHSAELPGFQISRHKLPQRHS